MPLGGVAYVLAGLLARQIVEPISGGDELRYHASRVLYWIGNQSVFPYPTHNDRQVVFGYQGELSFLWPVLFTRSELVGRIVFWLGTPLAFLGVYLVARKLRAGRFLSSVLTLLFALTPIVIRYGSGLKPEMWGAAFWLAFAWWLLHALECPDSSGAARRFGMAGVFAALAIHAKFTAIVALPVLILVPVVAAGVRRPFGHLRSAAIGLFSGAVLSGLALLLTFNTLETGHPFGTKAMRRVHSAELSVRQLRTHLYRLPLLLVEPPFLETVWRRQALERAGQKYLRAVDADRPLPLEAEGTWPGAFAYHVFPVASRFSLGGLFLILSIVAGGIGLIAELAKTTPSIRISGRSALWLLAAGSLGLVAGVIRWMPHSGLPDRFLIPSYALAIALLPAALPARILFPLLVVCLPLVALHPVREMTTAIGDLLRMRPAIVEDDGSWAETLEQIPAGARVLLIGDQNVLDYPLFGASDGYSRTVVPWGQHPFDATLLLKVTRERGITHVLFQDDRPAGFQWAETLPIQPFLTWMSTNADYQAVPLETPHQRLFTTKRAEDLPRLARPARPPVHQAPRGIPLVFVAAARRPEIGLGSGIVRTPWPIGRVEGEESGFLWLGSGLEEGLHFTVQAARALDVTLRVRAEAGPSRSDTIRTVVLREAGGNERRQVLTGSGVLGFPLRLDAGPNRVALFVQDEPTVAVMPNGDPRHLMVGVREVVVE